MGCNHMQFCIKNKRLKAQRAALQKLYAVTLKSTIQSLNQDIYAAPVHSPSACASDVYGEAAPKHELLPDAGISVK